MTQNTEKLAFLGSFGPFSGKSISGTGLKFHSTKPNNSKLFHGVLRFLVTLMTQTSHKIVIFGLEKCLI